MAESDTETKPSIDPINYLPLPLIRSDIIPPAPTRSDPPGSAMDWLPNFSDLAWIAYGASSLLVISHFPSPLSRGETAMGPIFRQVFELSGESLSAVVNAVSWSPTSPCVGELAAAAGNCIWLFGHDSATSKGSFCWSQNAILVQSTKVEAIGWTGSGDGIISGGVEVVLWRRNSRFWEIAWKFKVELPQTLVTATWSIEGPFATAAYTNITQAEGSSCNEESKRTYVCQKEAKLTYGKLELNHPQPMSMIQWRPPNGRQLNGDGKTLERNFLLTCCLDGTVRLWCEIDNGRVRKNGKDSNDHRTRRRSFCVAAVIEINQSMRGILGMNIFVTWATEVEGISETGAGMKKFFSSEVYDREKAGSCEWIVGFGPGRLVSLWAVHCLDDVSPMRFPRVTLWKTLEQKDIEVDRLCRMDLQNSREKLFLSKVAVLRNNASSAPTVCSLMQLVSSNSLVWSRLYPENSGNIKDSPLYKDSIEDVSYSNVGFLNLHGHTGKIIQVAIHPYSCEVEMAVSLDSNGLLLFWSLSTISNCIIGRPTLIPTWEIYGKLGTGESCSRYTSLRWAPAILDQELFLLMGHVGGIDCFIVKIYPTEDENIECHYVCTIPFAGHGPFEEGPTDIFSIPLPSPRNEILKSHKFMLVGVWLNAFQALSWEVTLHSYDSPGKSCNCNFEAMDAADCSIWGFRTTFSGKTYCVNIVSSSSQFPEPHRHDHVTSYDVVYPHSMVSQKSASFSDENCSPPAYTMATGCRNGYLKLWRSKLGETPTSDTPWELVGMFMAHQGPISDVCLSYCGRKIATICKKFHSNSASCLSLWESVHVAGAGAFVLEDTINLDEQVVALNWLDLSNGQLLLGVCMQNQLCIYAQRCYGGQSLLDSGQFLKEDVWYQIAFARTSSPINDFLWGPRATTLAVHDSFLSVISQWLFLTDRKHQIEINRNHQKSNSLNSTGEKEKDVHSAIFSDCGVDKFAELSADDGSKQCSFGTPACDNMKGVSIFRGLLASKTELEHLRGSRIGLWNMLEVVEKFSGSMKFYHAEALLVNIFTGNWKRAYSSVKHLVECLSHASEKKHGIVKHYIIPQIPLSNYFEGPLPNSLPDKGFNWGGNATLTTSSSQFSMGVSPFAYNFELDSSNNLNSSSTKSELSAFIDSLEKFYKLAAITNEEKLQILAIVDLLGEVTSPHSAYGSLDEPGQRFWVALKFQQLHFVRRFGKPATLDQVVIDYSLIVWAYHSDCEENLFGSVLPNEPSWPDMRNLGVGFWFTNTAQLRAKMEKLARQQYLKNKNPKDCALLYIALNRIQVLAGLFKISKDEKDKPLVGFLLRNFKEEKNKAAALKNAYVLLGKHQLELAIAFFLLGGDTASAVNVCAKTLGDEQLALVICRLVEGCGGPAEHHLITKIMLPSAIEKGNNWLASLLEWELGNYYQSFMRMFDLQIDSGSKNSIVCSKNVSFLKPNIGLYCLTLATKNSMRNAIGDHNSAILGRWAILMTATALNRRGLPLEALECFSSSPSVLENMAKGDVSNFEHSNILHQVLKPSLKDSLNWLSYDVAFDLENHSKLDLALKYFSKLIREHPSWEDIILKPPGSGRYENHQYAELLESFREKFYTGLHQFEQKFSVLPLRLISKILVSLHNHGLLFVGSDLLNGYVDKIQTVDGISLHRSMNWPLLKVAEETSRLFSRFIAACSVTCSQTKFKFFENDENHECGSSETNSLGYYSQSLLLTLGSLRASLRMIDGSVSQDLIKKPLMILDLVEYVVYFAYAWLQRSYRALFLAVKPLLVSQSSEHTLYDVDLANMKLLLPDDAEVSQNSLHDDQGESQSSKFLPENQGSDTKSLIPEDERCEIIAACLWQHMSRFLKHKLITMSYKLEEIGFSGLSRGNLSSGSSRTNLESDLNSSKEQVELVSLTLVNLLKTTVEHASSTHVKQLASYLRTKMEYKGKTETIVWLEEFNQSQRVLRENLVQDIVHVDATNENEGYDILWEICADPKMISESFAAEKIDFLQCFHHKPSKGWSEMYDSLQYSDDAAEIHNQNCTPRSSSETTETGEPARGLPQDGSTSLNSRQKDTTVAKEIASFLSPREVLKRNGELLEALCINSIHQDQAAVASNRKGILFFNWEDMKYSRDASDYIWSDADWPLNGWAGYESAPAPTCVSPGIGLGSQNGTHLGLGGATVGVGSSAKPKRDLTGGAAFGIPGYAGIGASGLGWETDEEFEEVVDPPPTAANISTRAFSSHPSRPIFLAGSSNTHIYLWEFGKDKATATYGVLPAANVPPPYALASISSLQFDHYGHRFASAAADGTICTWQLEVGGRSNIRPTETSHCFDSHASDVAYITSSGSIIVAAGYSPSGVNAVIWDTLAPPTTSRASIICHDGGACSLSVFDNDIGSGSISPLIVTGGKGGDVGIHDFRYIATGKTKRHKNSSSIDMQTGNSIKPGEQNLNGMVWYIPKAHSGSVTKIATIPNTSLFLTGSKDGDVKLWDAKEARMVFHWPKLHERHTFLQPSSRSFAGVVRVAVTDIQVVSHGFLTCGGDGSINLVELKANTYNKAPIEEK